jgi:perosamine synthetase
MIPQYVPHIGEGEAIVVSEYMRSPGFLTEYKRTAELERRIADYLGVKHCIMVNNGTISLSLALLALGIKPGDEVIVPNLTMIASINAIRFIGAIPILVDVDDRVLLNTDRAKARIKANSNIRAVMFVSLNGRHFEDDEFIHWCKSRQIALIDDAAQSFGSCDFSGKKVGSLCDIASFSFSMPKIITMGQGGCLTTNDDWYAKTLRRLKDFGRDGGGNDNHEHFGINCKFTELQAVIGIEQLSTIEWRVERKKEMYQRYYDNLKDVAGIQFIETDLSITTPWFMDIYVDNQKRFIEEMKKRGIGCRAIYPALHTQPTCAKFATKEFIFLADNSTKYGNKGVWLPSSFNLTLDQIDYICDNIKEIKNG